MVQDGGIGNSLIWVPTDEPPHMGGAFRVFPCQDKFYGLMMRSCTAREAAAEMVAQPSLKRAVFR